MLGARVLLSARSTLLIIYGQRNGENQWYGDRPTLRHKMLTQDEIYEVLRECYDPELPVNVVDLGLIYNVVIENGGVNVQMTLTAPGCSMGAMIATEIEDKLLGIPDCERAQVEIVWDPPWTPHRMSETARQQLGLDD
jgi:metal-sulfur cluster biosynthetic enzyme